MSIDSRMRQWTHQYANDRSNQETLSALHQENGEDFNPQHFIHAHTDGLIPPLLLDIIQKRDVPFFNIDMSEIGDIESILGEPGGELASFIDYINTMAKSSDPRICAFQNQLLSFSAALQRGQRFQTLSLELQQQLSLIGDQGERARLIKNMVRQFKKEMQGACRICIPMRTQERIFEGANSSNVLEHFIFGNSENTALLMIDFGRLELHVVNSNPRSLSAMHAAGISTDINDQNQFVESAVYQKYVTYSDCSEEALASDEFFEFLFLNTLSSSKVTINEVCDVLSQVTGGKKERAMDPMKYPKLYGKPPRTTSSFTETIYTALSYELMGAFEKNPKHIKKGDKAYKLIKWKNKFGVFLQFFGPFGHFLEGPLRSAIPSAYIHKFLPKLQSFVLDALNEYIENNGASLTESIRDHLGFMGRFVPEFNLETTPLSKWSWLGLPVPEGCQNLTLREVIESEHFIDLIFDFRASGFIITLFAKFAGFEIPQLLKNKRIGECEIIELLQVFLELGADQLSESISKIELFSHLIKIFIDGISAMVSNMARATLKPEVQKQLTEEEYKEATIAIAHAYDVLERFKEKIPEASKVAAQPLIVTEERIPALSGVESTMWRSPISSDGRAQVDYTGQEMLSLSVKRLFTIDHLQGIELVDTPFKTFYQQPMSDWKVQLLRACECSELERIFNEILMYERLEYLRGDPMRLVVGIQSALKTLEEMETCREKEEVLSLALQVIEEILTPKTPIYTLIKFEIYSMQKGVIEDGVIQKSAILCNLLSGMQFEENLCELNSTLYMEFTKIIEVCFKSLDYIDVPAEQMWINLSYAIESVTLLMESSFVAGLDNIIQQRVFANWLLDMVKYINLHKSGIDQLPEPLALKLMSLFNRCSALCNRLDLNMTKQALLIKFGLYALNIRIARAFNQELLGASFYSLPLVLSAKNSTFRFESPEEDQLFFDTMEILDPFFSIEMLGDDVKPLWVNEQEQALFCYSNLNNLKGNERSNHLQSGRFPAGKRLKDIENIKSIQGVKELFSLKKQTNTELFYRDLLKGIVSDEQKKEILEERLPILKEDRGEEKYFISFVEAFTRGELNGLGLIHDSLYQLNQSAIAAVLLNEKPAVGKVGGNYLILHRDLKKYFTSLSLNERKKLLESAGFEGAQLYSALQGLGCSPAELFFDFLEQGEGLFEGIDVFSEMGFSPSEVIRFFVIKNQLGKLFSYLNIDDSVGADISEFAKSYQLELNIAISLWCSLESPWPHLLKYFHTFGADQCFKVMKKLEMIDLSSPNEIEMYLEEKVLEEAPLISKLSVPSINELICTIDIDLYYDRFASQYYTKYAIKNYLEDIAPVSATLFTFRKEIRALFSEYANKSSACENLNREMSYDGTIISVKRERIDYFKQKDPASPNIQELEKSCQDTIRSVENKKSKLNHLREEMSRLGDEMDALFEEYKEAAFPVVRQDWLKLQSFKHFIDTKDTANGGAYSVARSDEVRQRHDDFYHLAPDYTVCNSEGSFLNKHVFFDSNDSDNTFGESLKPLTENDHIFDDRNEKNPLQEMRFHSISKDPASRALNILNYLNEYPSVCENPAIVKKIIEQFFRPGAISYAIKNVEGFSEILTANFNQLFERSKEGKFWGVFGALALFISDISEFLLYFEGKNLDALSSENLIERLMGVIQPEYTQIDGWGKIAVLEALVQLIQKSNKPINQEKFFDACLMLQLSYAAYGKPKKCSNEAIAIMRSVIQSPVFDQYIEISKFSELLFKVTGNKTVYDSNWSKNGLFFEHLEKNCDVDLVTGQIIIDEGVLRPVSKGILCLPNFIQFFGTDCEIVTGDSGVRGLYGLKFTISKEGREIEIFYEEGKENENAVDTSIFTFPVEEVYPKLCNEPFEVPYGELVQTSDITLLYDVIPSLKYEKNCVCIAAENAMFVLKNGDPIYVVLDDRIKSFIDRPIYRASLDSLPDSISSQFTQFNFPEANIHVWCDQESRKLHKISLLSFEGEVEYEFIVKQNKLYSIEHPGFYIDRTEHVKEISECFKKITLVNDAGARRFLISGLLNENHSFFEMVQFGSEIFPKWIEIGLKEGKILPLNDQSYLPLALLLLHTFHVKEAMQLIEGYSLKRKCAQHEFRILSAIISVLTIFKFPGSHAYALKVLVKMHENIAKYSNGEKSSIGAEIVNSIVQNFGNLELESFLNNELADLSADFIVPVVIVQHFAGYELDQSNHPELVLSDNELESVLEFYHNILADCISEENDGESMTQKMLRDFFKNVFSPLLKSFVKEKKGYLKTGKGRLGVRPTAQLPLHLIHSISQGAITFAKGIVTHEQLERSYPGEVIDHIDLSDFDLVQADDFFESNFWSIFKILIEGTLEEKQRLRWMINVVPDNVKGPWTRLIKELLEDTSRLYAHCQIEEKRVELERVLALPLPVHDVSIENPIERERRYNHAVSRHELMISAAARAYSECFTRISTSNVLIRLGNVIQQKVFENETLEKAKVAGSLFHPIDCLSQLFFGTYTVTERISCVFRSIFESETKNIKEKRISRPIQMEYDVQVIDQHCQNWLNGVVDQFFTRSISEDDVQCTELTVEYDGDDQNISHYVERVNQDILAYREEFLDEVLTTFTFNDTSMRELQNVVESKIIETKTALLGMQNIAITYLNSCDLDDYESRLKKIAFKKQSDWKSLRELALKGDYALFKQETALSDEEAEELIKYVLEILVTETRLDQMEIALKKIKKWETLEQKDTEEAISQAHDIAVTLSGERFYVPSVENIHYLMFETVTGFHYRKLQIQKIEECLDAMKEKNMALLEAPTGFGKTKAVIPTLNLKMAQRGFLVVNAWPYALANQNMVDIETTMDTCFHTQIKEFTFRRDSKMSVKQLKRWVSELDDAMERGIPINLSPQSLMAFQLHWQLYLDQPPSKENNQIIRLMMEILVKFRQYGFATIDESHEVLSPKDLLIYTIGTTNQITDEEIVIINKAIEFLETDEFLHKTFNICENEHHLGEFNEEVRECLAGKFLAWFNSVDNRYYKLSSGQEEHFLNFVLKREQTNAKAALKDHPRFSDICMIKGLISCDILKAALSEKVGVGYQISKQHGKKYPFAVPNAAPAQPKETDSGPSQYQSPHITFAKSRICYAQKQDAGGGMRREQAEAFIDRLQKAYIADLDTDLDENEFESVKQYKRFFPKTSEMISLSGLQLQHTDMILDEGRFKPDVLDEVLRTDVRKAYEIYSTTMEASMQDFARALKKKIAGSGSPQDPEAAGTDVQFIPMAGTEGRTAHLLLTKCTDGFGVRLLDPAKTVEEMVTEIANIKSSEGQSYDALIDLGANFVGMKNIDVSRILGRFAEDDIQRIVLFDDETKLICEYDIQANKIQAVDLDLAGRQSFYDASHFTGADIPHGLKARAFMPIGADTTLDGLTQGGGRMRQWHYGQQVDLLVPDYVAEQMSKEFGINKEGISIQDVLIYSIKNQVETKKLYNAMSQMQQMDAIVKSALYEQMLGLSAKENKKLSVKRARSLFKANRTLFIKNTKIDPISVFGDVPIDAPDTIEALEAYKEHLIKKIKQIKGLSKEKKKEAIEEIREMSGRWRNAQFVKPKTLPLRNDASVETDTEAQNENEMDTQQETAQQVEDVAYKRKISEWDEGIDLFQPGWETPVSKTKLVAIAAFQKLACVLSAPITGKILQAVIINLAAAATGTIMVICSVAFPIILVSLGIIQVSILGICLLIQRISKSLNANNHTASFKKIVAHRLPAKYRGVSGMFSKKLLTSNNWNVFAPQSIHEEVQHPFEGDQKDLREVLVIQDLVDDVWKTQVIMGDSTDLRFWKRKLKVDRKSDIDISERKRRVLTWSIAQQTITDQGKNAIQNAELLENTQFLHLIAEAMFAGIEVTGYSEEGLGHLSERAERIQSRSNRPNSVKNTFGNFMAKRDRKKVSRFKKESNELNQALTCVA